jgi:hypothetical protein
MPVTSQNGAMSRPAHPDRGRHLRQQSPIIIAYQQNDEIM